MLTTRRSRRNASPALSEPTAWRLSSTPPMGPSLTTVAKASPETASWYFWIASSTLPVTMTVSSASSPYRQVAAVSVAPDVSGALAATFAISANSSAVSKSHRLSMGWPSAPTGAVGAAGTELSAGGAGGSDGGTQPAVAASAAIATTIPTRTRPITKPPNLRESKADYRRSSAAEARVTGRSPAPDPDLRW